MKLIKPSFEIMEQEPGFDGMLKHIERVARICYQSQDKITENSAETFVKRLINLGHLAAVEHGTIYLTGGVAPNTDLLDSYIANQFSNVDISFRLNNFIITTNYRVILENKWEEDLKFMVDDVEPQFRRISVKFIADIGVMREFFRHRVFSLMQESTRYCDYGKSDITFIIPSWSNLEEGVYETDGYHLHCNGETVIDPPVEEVKLVRSLIQAEDNYKSLRHELKPEEARAVLPLALKSEAVMTGDMKAWKHFFDLRCSKNAHPDAKRLAIPLKEEFERRGYFEIVNSNTF